MKVIKIYCFTSLILLFLASCIKQSISTYYVSVNGNDNANGTEKEPFKTLHFATSVLKKGDTLYIRAGNYYETLKVQNSGARDQPIVISNYQNEQVIIHGAGLLKTNWRIHEKDIWVTELPDDINDFSKFQLFRGEQALVEARWPNMPCGKDMSSIGEYGPYRAVAQDGTDKNGVVVQEKFDSTIVGGGICIWPGEHGASAWGPRSRKISGYDGKKLFFDVEVTSDFFSGIDPNTPYPGNAFFLFGSMGLLDNENEYFLDEKERKLYLQSNYDPSADNIRIKRRNVGLSIDNISYVLINGLKIVGATLNGNNLNHVVVQNCKFHYPEYLRFPNYGEKNSKQGMVLKGNDIEFRNNEIGYSSASGLFVKGSRIKIVNNYIHDIATSGIGSGVYLGADSEYLLLANNSIIRSGRSHFLCQGGRLGEDENKFNEKYIKPAHIKEVVIERNYLQDHNTYTSDCALFYAWNVDGGGTKFRYNYCIETMKANGRYKYSNGKMGRQIQGLYSDNFCKNMEFSSNIVINATTGIQANNFNENILNFNNTIINPTKEMVATYGYMETPGYMRGCRIYNNDFFTKDTTRNIYLGIHCDKGTFLDPGEVRQEYIKKVSFKNGKTLTLRYDLPDSVFAYSVVDSVAGSTFEIAFDHYDPSFRNAESKGNRIFTSSDYANPEFYNNYFKLPNGERLENFGSELSINKD